MTLSRPEEEATTTGKQREPSSTATTQQQEIKELLEELKGACHRTLFEEIVDNRKELPSRRRDAPSDGNEVVASQPAQAAAETRQPKHPRRTPRKSWETLLANAASVAPIMTLQEFGTVSRFAAIYLFGFLVPWSTGNDFFIAQHTKRQQQQQMATGMSSSQRYTSEWSSTVVVDIIEKLSLEERLENCSRFYSQSEFGEENCIVNPTRERAFRSFLTNGIGPLLASRPAHPTETDLLHLCAMIISPQPQQEFIRQTAKTLNEKDSSSWTRTKRLMASIHPRSFHVNASHRLMVVEMMANRLVLPEKEVGSHGNAAADFLDDPLLDGAVPHLRAALHSFAVGSAAGNVGASRARSALVNIAVRTGDTVTVYEEWDALVNSVANDVTECEYSDETSHHQSDLKHVSVGTLLERFILNYNESRHYADAEFTQRALDSFSWCLERSLTSSQPCLLASIIMAARSLFYFLLPTTAIGEARSDDEVRDGIIRTAIQSLSHPDVRVVRAASSLVALAFAYNPSDLTLAYVRAVEESIRTALNSLFSIADMSERDATDQHFRAFHNVVITLSRMSPSFASNMLEYLLDKLQKLEAQDGIASCASLRMISTIATARPVAAQKYCDSILSLAAKVGKDDACKGQLVATLFTPRQTHFFAQDSRKDVEIAGADMMSVISNEWMKYKLACQALVTGNSRFAKNTFDSIIRSTSSESSFLWLSVLSNVAKAEDELAYKGCRGILSATPPLYTAVSYVQSLADMTGNSCGYQIEYLGLRVDSLEQFACLHSLCREIQLSGTVPKATTRTGLHLRNSLRLFYSLAGRYYSLYKRYGLFTNQQSRTALRTCHAICRWLGDAGRAAFPEASFPRTEKDDSTTWPRGDQLHPSILLLKKLNGLVLQSMDGSVDPRLRGAAMAQTLDAILMTPFPFPLGFTCIMSIPSTVLRLSIKRSESADATNVIHIDEETVQIPPGKICAIVATGQIPSPVFQKAKLPFSHILVWHRDRYVGPLDVDDEAIAEGAPASVPVKKNRQDGDSPQVSSLLPGGRFTTPIKYQAPPEEGLYSIEMTLGCRDVRCGEWELPLDGNCRTLRFRVMRPRG